MLCKYSKDLSQGLEVKLCCNIDNQVCGFYRYCVTKKSIVMRDTYINCPKRSDQMGRPKKVNIEENTALSPTENLETEDKIDTIEEKPKLQKSKQKKQICKAIYKTDKKFAIEFDGCGISFRDSSSNKTNQVEVIYSGKFKTPTFKIESYKFI
jgi:hypothetical protein